MTAAVYSTACAMPATRGKRRRHTNGNAVATLPRHCKPHDWGNMDVSAAMMSHDMPQPSAARASATSASVRNQCFGKGRVCIVIDASWVRARADPFTG